MKHRTFRAILAFIAALMIFTAGALRVSAESSGEGMSEATAGIDTDGLYSALPDDTREILDDSGITPSGGVDRVSVGDVLEFIVGLIKDSAAKPLKMLGTVTAVILLSSLLAGFSEASGKGAKTIYPLVTAAVSAVMISTYLSEIIRTAQTAFTAASDFMLGYIPVIAGVTAISGHQASAAVFSSVTLSAIQILARAVCWE